MRHLKTLASALAIVAVLVMATDYIAMAATGKPLILGQVNKSGKTTTIQSSKGAALKLKVDSDKPPLKVNSTTMVKKLNAAKVGGKSASQLGVRTVAYTKSINVASGTGFNVVTPGVPAGRYQLAISGWLDLSGVGASPYCYSYGSVGPGDPATEVLSTAGGNFVTVNMVGIFDAAEGETLSVQCNGLRAAAGPITSSTLQPFTIMLTPIDTATVTPLARKGAKTTTSTNPDPTK